MFALSINATHYFQKKKNYKFLIFLNNARKSCAPFIEILFLMINSSTERPSHVNPSHPNAKKSPWKRLYTS